MALWSWLIQFIGWAGAVLLSSAVSAGLSGYLVSRWKTREDVIEKRLDEAVTEIRAVAEDAAAYWQAEAADPKTKMLAAKVQAGIARLDGYRSLLAPAMSTSSASELVLASAAFMRAATRGDFGVHNRTSDIQRAVEVYQMAAAYAVSIRRARMLDLKGWRRRA